MLKLKLRRSYIAATHDICMAAASFVLSLYLRLGEQFAASPALLWQGTAVFTLVCASIFFAFKLHRRVWRYASFQDLVVITKAVTLSILVFLPAMFLLTRLEGMPRSVLFINWMLLLALLGGSRFLYRALKEKQLVFDMAPASHQPMRIPILLAGMNSNAELFLREVSQGRSPDYEVVGIVDADKSRYGSHIYGIKIYGDFDSIPKIATKLKRRGKTPRKIILTDDNIDKALLRQLLSIADMEGMTLARLPKLTDFKDTDRGARLELKPLVIEDLLGRSQNRLDRGAMQALIQGKRVLVTGGGGTIGSELTRQIAGYNPAHITIIDNSEYNLYAIDKEMEERYPTVARRALVGDIRNLEMLQLAFREALPELVFHAAALKHVPIVEDNMHEAVLTNIIGTKNIADCCLAFGVAGMVLISTDKAVNPTNIMGATKRVAESYTQALGHDSSNHSTTFMTVRFGNVLGSSGSVIPLFQRQLAEGGPITVTHPDMVRYFMTVREAVELVLQASVMGMESSQSAIFVLDMGEPVKITDLATQMIKMAGLRPQQDIQIVYTGLRPGEKLFEELFHASESLLKTAHEGIMLAAPRLTELTVLKAQLGQIHDASRVYNTEEAIRVLKALVPEYQNNRH